ncbi:MAG TPA: carboxypeptidase regulatory-like domain-containing protein [Tepidisphaeraceae bacterium]|nr:carboxypeptidase regulatory-like domain-containing protein [Tepidisphaeraceae bacterium]
MKRRFVPVLLTLFLSSLTRAAAPPSQSTGGLPSTKDTATLTGTIFFTGDKPTIRPITDIAGSAFCREHHKDQIPMKDTFLFGQTADHKTTVQNVLVYISKGLENKDFDPPKTPVLLDQVGCMYVPHVVAVMAGQILTVRNSDETLHNVMASPQDNDPFNFGMPVAGSTNDISFKSPEMKINVKCFMHPWMSGYIHVLANPFFAVTGPDGSFTLTGLPPGTYTLSVLHESSLLHPTPPTADITVKAGDKQQVDFTYSLKSK